MGGTRGLTSRKPRTTLRCARSWRASRAASGKNSPARSSWPLIIRGIPLPDEKGFRCGCAAGDPEWRTWLLLAGRGLRRREDMGRCQLGPVPGDGAAGHVLGGRRPDDRRRRADLLPRASRASCRWPSRATSRRTAYNINKTRITLPNGSVIQGYSADSAERARGANLFGCWCDELALFKYETFLSRGAAACAAPRRRADAHHDDAEADAAAAADPPESRGPGQPHSRHPGEFATRTRISPRCAWLS